MIQCNRCHLQYIGETKRRLKDRFNEHRRIIVFMARDQRETHESFKRKQTTEKWRLWRFWLSLLVENIDNFLSRTVFISPALLYYFI